MKVLSSLFCVLLTGCVMKSDVKPVGENKYMVSGQSSAKAYKVEQEVTVKAEEYCQTKHKHVEILTKSDNETFNGWVPHTVSLTFACN